VTKLLTLPMLTLYKVHWHWWYQRNILWN